MNTQTEQQQPERTAAVHVEVDDLDDREREHYEFFVKGFREGLGRFSAVYRQEVVTEFLELVRAGKAIEDLWTEHHTLAQVLYPAAKVSKPSAKAACLALERMFAEIRDILDPADQLNAMEPEIRAVIGRLSPETKAIIRILGRLRWLDSLSIDIEFGVTISDELEDQDSIKLAFDESPDDPDVQTMRKAHDLICRVEDAEHN